MSESIVERLALIEPDWADVTRRSQRLRMQTLRRQALLTVGGVLAAAVLAGGAYAAARAIWGGHDMTPADIQRQATVVTSECDGQGRCTPVTPSHKEVNIVPSMGVVFVLPDGDSTSLVPAFPIWNIPAAGGPGELHGQPLRDDSGNTWGRAHVLRNGAGAWNGGVWIVPLPEWGNADDHLARKNWHGHSHRPSRRRDHDETSSDRRRGAAGSRLPHQ